MRPFKIASAAITLVLVPWPQPAAAQDVMKIAVGQRGITGPPGEPHRTLGNAEARDFISLGFHSKAAKRNRLPITWDRERADIAGVGFRGILLPARIGATPSTADD